MQVLLHFGNFGAVPRVFRRSALVVAAVCRMVTAWDRGARRRCRSPSVRRSARNIGRRATPLPSPPLGGVYVSSVLCLPSLVVVAVCCWWLLLMALYDDLRQEAGACNMVRYYITYNRARNKRARTRRGETCIKHFPASLRYAGGVLGGYSCEDIKSRGGALKCDYDSLVLFGGVYRGQKKDSSSGTDTVEAAFLFAGGA